MAEDKPQEEQTTALTGGADRASTNLFDENVAEPKNDGRGEASHSGLSAFHAIERSIEEPTNTEQYSEAAAQDQLILSAVLPSEEVQTYQYEPPPSKEPIHDNYETQRIDQTVADDSLVETHTDVADGQHDDQSMEHETFGYAQLAEEQDLVPDVRHVPIRQIRRRHDLYSDK